MFCQSEKVDCRIIMGNLGFLKGGVPGIKIRGGIIRKPWFP